MADCRQRFDEGRYGSAEIPVFHHGLSGGRQAQGSHFFQDLVESGVFYLALFKEQEGVIFHEEKLREAPNLLERFLTDAAAWKNVIHVADVKRMELYSDISCQRVFCK